MEEELENILCEKEAGSWSGDLGARYSVFLDKLSHHRDFLALIQSKLGQALTTGNFPRFNFLSYLIQTFGRDSKNQKEVYVLMMDFLVRYHDVGNGIHPEYEEATTTVLDLFWHQMEPLRNLNNGEQQKLAKVLEIAATFKYQITDFGDEPYFAINKSMDLIKFVRDHGPAHELVSLYRNHFDPMVRERLKKSVLHKNWL